MKWHIRFMKNAVFGILPGSSLMRSIKRRVIPYPARIPEATLEEGLQQIEMLQKSGCSLEGKTVLEIGTGWLPIIPLLFCLGGAKKVIMVDSQKLMDERLFRETLLALIKYSEKIATRLRLAVDEVVCRLSSYKLDMKSSLDAFGLRYYAPCDVRTITLEENVDIITSHEVFEHVSPDILNGVLKTCNNISSNNAYMCHFIDNSDHWEHQDSSIPRLNFLRYGDDLFSLICRFNPLDYQNRLRHFEYLALFNKNGFCVCDDWSEVNNRALQELKKIRLSKRFASIPYEQLAIVTSRLVLTKINTK